MDPPNPCKCISVQEWFKNVQLYCYILFSTVPLVAGYRTVLKTEIAMIERISSNIKISGYGTGKVRYGTGKVRYGTGKVSIISMFTIVNILIRF